MREKFIELKEHLRKLIPHQEAGLIKKISFWVATGLVSLFLFGMIVFASMIAILSIGLPDVTDLEKFTSESTQIFDRDGVLLYTIHGDENREQVDNEEIAQYLKDATIAIEDDEFFEHKGFDVWAIGRALLYEIGIGTPRGGSTITQQYVKNTFLSAERSYVRKAKELILALRVERAYSKEEILALYLNRIPYGNNAYGCQIAAQTYFEKECKDLTLAESAILASLPQAPTRYSPYGDNKFSHLLKEFTLEELDDREIETELDLDEEEYIRGLIGQHVALGNGETVYIQGRSDLVLKRMFELGYIDEEERQIALNEIQKLEFSTYRESIKSPHFVLYIKEILEEKYGKDVVEQGGLKVYTTIDSELQKYAEEVIAEKGAINAERYGADNAASLTINAKTGEILSMVGSRDYFNEEIDGNVNVVMRPRQPGSSFKPIVYAQAFYNGYGPGTTIYDIPTRLGSDRPQNYDGKWQGQISIRQALGQSRNIPAIMAYYLAGEQDRIIELAEKMGITSLNKSHSYGYPLALGAGEISLFEMVRAYSVFATNGKKPEITGILRVENNNGDILEEWKPEEEALKFEEVLDPQIAYLINSILSDKKHGVGPRLYINGKTNAAKTGTSTKESKKGGTITVQPSDGWTIGYTPTIVTGVWIGNTDGRGLNYNATGYEDVAPIWNAIMTKALEDLPDEAFPEPEGIKHIKISKSSGKLPGKTTPDAMIIEEVFASFAVPTEQDQAFYTVKIDKISGLLATEFTPEDAIEEVIYQKYEPVAPMFNWAAEIEAFYKDKLDENSGTNIRIGMPPTEKDNVHTAETLANKPTISIISPTPQSILGPGLFDVEVDISAPNGIEKVEFFLDEEKEYFTITSPYVGHLNISRFLKDNSLHLVVAKIIDKYGYSAQAAIEIKIDMDNTEQ